VHAYLPGARRDEAQEQAQRGGLAGAVGAEQRIDLAGADVQVELLQDGLAALAGDDGRRLQDMAARGHSRAGFDTQAFLLVPSSDSRSRCRDSAGLV
jgi:hypothetical protein